MRATLGKAQRFVIAASLVAGAATPAHANTSTAFPSGSLIIPTNSAFQDNCGAVAAYGLIYSVLRANPWLAANGYTPITVFYTFLDTKASPNRCVPTSLDTPPAPSASAAWNDGCDILNVSAVQVVNNNRNAPDFNITTFNNSSKTNIYPRYPSRVVTPGNTVSYLGGPFVILPSDAATFRKLLDNTISANDVYGNVIDFAKYRTRNATQTAAPTSGCTLGSDHYVNIHRATSAFVANIGKAFGDVPPRLALLATNKNALTGTVSNNILQGYLTNAGLTYPGANGCPPLSVQATNTAVCPNGAVSGQIYDSFDFEDFGNNQLTATVAGKPLYTMLWTPHWETKATASASPTAAEMNAMAKIATFLNGQTGLSAECASLSAYEGDANNGTNSERAGLQLQTCVNNGAGACSATTTFFGLNRNTNPPDIDTRKPTLRNCSDPDLATGAECAYYSYPGDSFVQTGDYLWLALGGHTASYKAHATPNSIYRPGVVPLVSHVMSLDKTKLGTPVPYSGTPSPSAVLARPMIDAEFSTRSIKDNTPGKANILYLAAHNLTPSVAGTRMMIQTLLQLGLSNLPPISFVVEVSRSSPIATTMNGAPTIVQGTYEFLTPAGTIPTFSANGDNATFKFPYTKGHLRGRTASAITTTVSAFGGAGVVFDAAGLANIPEPVYAGGGCSTYFTSACRTVFTTTVGGANPALRFFNENEAPTLGPLMGANLDAANQQLLIKKILAGDDSLIPGQFHPALGGVDRSTVAIIETSPLVNGTRPLMAYVGAADGMLHAVCMSVAGPCDIVGRELWAYVPRVLLSTVRYNTARIDGSPHVIDAYGDFTNSGKKSWRTILMFQTGTGDTTGMDRVPAVYALDISNPASPSVLWEFSLADTSARQPYELGVGLTLAAGRVQNGINGMWMAFAQTNNAGTLGNGDVVTAINIETGQKVWQAGYQFVAGLRSGGTSVPPATGVPGGAVAIDKTGNGYVTDVVWGTLYGDVWQVEPIGGVSRYGAGKPLFRFSTDFHPIGTKPAIYSKGGTQYAVVTTGGYVEQFPNDTSWTTAGVVNYAVSMSLNTPAASAPINENTLAPNIAFKLTLGAGEKGIAQATVIGNQVFITTDTANTNDNTNPGAYGTTGASGRVYRYDFGTNTQGTTVLVQGGASSVINAGNAVYSGASDQQQRLASDASCFNCGTSVDPSQAMKVSRKLWLRSQCNP
jgi:hypothetical protein